MNDELGTRVYQKAIKDIENGDFFIVPAEFYRPEREVAEEIFCGRDFDRLMGWGYWLKRRLKEDEVILKFRKNAE